MEFFKRDTCWATSSPGSSPTMLNITLSEIMAALRGMALLGVFELGSGGIGVVGKSGGILGKEGGPVVGDSRTCCSDFSLPSSVSVFVCILSLVLKSEDILLMEFWGTWRLGTLIALTPVWGGDRLNWGLFGDDDKTDDPVDTPWPRPLMMTSGGWTWCLGDESGGSVEGTEGETAGTESPGIFNFGMEN